MPSPLATLVFWAAVLCCIVAEVAIVRSTAHARRPVTAGDGELALLPPSRRGAEVAWAVLPALVLAGVLAWTWREMRRPPALPAPSAPAAAADPGHQPGAVP